MASFPDVERYLYALRNRGAKLGLERMAAFNEALGHPDQAFPIIHVAGTNGKGSVCAMLEAIYRGQGLRTGMFTSPHLVRLGERIRVNGQPLSDEAIARWVQTLRPVAERLAASDASAHPTFFEFMTAMAFLNFQARGVDVAILETGLGGRLDSTNVVEPAVCVITSISWDHQEQLGDTLTLIAREKAGILKPGAPVVLGRLPGEAEAEIRRVAAERGCPVTSVVEAWGGDAAAYPETNLSGAHQRVNAATAWLAARLASPSLPFAEGLAREALGAVTWPGRWQRVTLRDGRTLILEAAHNAEGAVALDENLARLRAETGRGPVILCGTLGVARAVALMEVVARHASAIQLLVPDQPRACSFAELRAALPSGFAGAVADASVPDLFPGPGVCVAGGPGDTLVATGSIYLLGEILARLEDTTGQATLQDRV